MRYFMFNKYASFWQKVHVKMFLVQFMVKLTIYVESQCGRKFYCIIKYSMTLTQIFTDQYPDDFYQWQFIYLFYLYIHAIPTAPK